MAATTRRLFGSVPLLLLLAALAIVSLACAGRKTERARAPGAGQRGEASWYGPGFHGRTTANGETYDMHALTAAHRELPFDTLVEVTNLANGRRVVVRINDSGPFVRGRIIDLSRAAAEELDMIGRGVTAVKLVVLRDSPALQERPVYLVQAGAFRDPDLARDLSRSLQSQDQSVRVESDGQWHRVLLGPFQRLSEAEALVQRLATLGVAALVRRQP